MRTVPVSGVSRPAMTRSRVDLPPPLGPEQRGERPARDLERDVVEATASPKRLEIDSTRMLTPPPARARPRGCGRVTVRSDQDDQGGEAQRHRADVGARGIEVVDAGGDEQGQGLGLAGDGTRHDGDGAELARARGPW